MKKKALILGATSSLATVFCRELAMNGWDLILCGRQLYELELLASDISIKLIFSIRKTSFFEWCNIKL